MSTRKDIFPNDPFAACKLAKERAGGSRILGPMLGITRQAVDAWKVVPYKHARRVSLETGISCHLLRPDIFGPAPNEAAE